MPGAGGGVGGGYNPAAGAGATGTTSPLNSITLGGGTRDYAADIYNNPAFKMLRDQLSSAGIADAAHLRGTIQQALIGFGAVPNLPTDVLQNSGLDTGETSALAAGNPFSTVKRLQQDYDDRQNLVKKQLAARGILDSGETGYQLGRLGQSQAQSQYDATSSLLGGISGLNDQYVAGRQAAASQLAQGAFSAQATAAQQNAGGGGGTVTATWNPATGTYVDPSGNHYDQGGNAIALPVQTPPPATAGGFSGAGSGGLAPTTPPPLYDPSRITRPGIGYAA